jgi:hypothetical protein
MTRNNEQNEEPDKRKNNRSLESLWKILQQITEPQKNAEQTEENEEMDGGDDKTRRNQSLFLMFNSLSLCCARNSDYFTKTSRL